MSTKDENSQFLFLITCIKNSNSGKVDFGAVAEQLGIVSKGAAAKRYERLMKAHGIGSNSIAAGPSTPKKGAVKKEKDTGSVVKPAAKKRKLKEVDSDAGDEDEPVKGEVKSEIKFEDVLTVKTEHGNGGIAVMAAPAQTISSQAEMPKQLSVDEDDDVFVISATQKTDSNVPIYSGDHHHWPMSAQHIQGIRSFDYAANMGYPPQATNRNTMPMTMMTSVIPRAGSGNPFPYGFAPSPFAHNHDTSDFFWQGVSMATPHPDGHQHKDDSVNKSL